MRPLSWLAAAYLFMAAVTAVTFAIQYARDARLKWGKWEWSDFLIVGPGFILGGMWPISIFEVGEKLIEDVKNRRWYRRELILRRNELLVEKRAMRRREALDAWEEMFNAWET